MIFHFPFWGDDFVEILNELFTLGLSGNCQGAVRLKIPRGEVLSKESLFKDGSSQLFSGCQRPG